MKRDDDVFADALAIPEAERAAFLARACADDPGQRDRVEALLRGHGRAPACFDRPTATNPSAEKPGDKIDHYKLLQKIGEGGCGVVYMAEQEEPVRRRVALKVIKLGMDTKAVVARFEAERQALALMDHLNIARVLDAGATESGRPYFVMELVRGIPITTYCDENHLTPTQRVELFITVCQAIQHAHQKGIIHRDIKPSNILVTVNDGMPTPKVIDFGIAKATQGRLTDQTLFTAFEQFIGTPVYMSPEQADMSSLDIDTRSDIYSLGVLLYELLTGQPPFDPKSFLKAGVDEIRHRIREVEPPKPSTRLRTLTDADQATAAKRRGTVPAQLSLLLRGDLDWIVMRCLEKDRTRRYDTANGLARDLQRHLRHEPVVARPPSTTYLLGKWVRRHRFGFAAAALIALVLVLGATVSTWLAIRATRAEHEQSRLRETAQDARAAESTLRQRAEAQELTARRRAYASDMNLLQQALADENRGRALALLNRQRPQPGETDLRGWEWRYLWQFCQNEAKSVLVKGARDSFSSVAASPDAKWLATEWDGSTGPNPIIWDLQTGTKTEIPVGSGVSHVAFSPREPILATVGNRSAPTRAGYVMLWNLDTRQKVNEWIFSSTGDPCTGLFFAEDGQTLVTSTASPQNEIRLWRVATGEKLASFSTGPTEGRSLWAFFAVSRDLKLAAYVSPGDAHVHVLDLVTGRKLWSSRAGAEQVTALSFSPDGKILASGEGFGKSPIRLWDAWSGIELGRMEGHRSFVSQFVFWPDGKTLASAGGDQTVRVWDVASRTLKRTLRGHTLEVHCLALLPDNKTLASGSKNGELLLWDTTTAEPATRAHTTIPGEVMVWRYSGDGSTIITVDPGGRIAERRGENYRDEKTLLQVGSKIWAADIIAREIANQGWIAARARASTTGSTILAGDSPRLAHVSADRNIEVWDWERGGRVSVIAANHGGERLAPLSFAAKGEKLFLSRLAQGPRRVIREEWDVASGRQTQSWKASPKSSGPPSAEVLSAEVLVTLSPDQKRFMSIAVPAALFRADLDNGSETRLQLDVRGAVTPGSFSPDSSLFAVPTLNHLVQVVNVDPLRSVTTLSGFLTSVHSVAFSPDGRRLAAGSGGGEAMTLWDVGSYERVLTIEAAGSLFRQAAFSPDGNVLGALSGSRESPTLHLWRAPTRAEIAAAEVLAAPKP